MPYEILERNGKHCVAKKDGEVLKCYSEKSQATSYLRALYANVTAAGFDPSKHPHRPSGDTRGGQWAPKFVAQELPSEDSPERDQAVAAVLSDVQTWPAPAGEQHDNYRDNTFAMMRAMQEGKINDTARPAATLALREPNIIVVRDQSNRVVGVAGYSVQTQSALDPPGVILGPGDTMHVETAGAVEGAGLPLFRAVIERAASTDSGVNFTHTTTSRPLYEKLGIPREGHNYTLTPEQVKEVHLDNLVFARKQRDGLTASAFNFELTWFTAAAMPAKDFNERYQVGQRLAGRHQPDLQRKYESAFRAQSTKSRKAAGSLKAAVDPQIPDGYINEEAFKDSVTKRTAAARKKMVNEVMVSLLGEAAVKGAAEEIGVLITTLATAQAENAYLAASDAVHSALLDGLTQGLSVDQTSDRVGEVMDEWAPWQAQRQAQTDLVSLSNGASLTAARILGPDAPQFKTWLSAGDDRVREAHRSLDRQTVGINDPFQFEEYSLMYPGDPAAPDGLIINCRCTQIYTDTAEASLAHSLDGGIIEDPLAMAAASFDESKHPRNEKGAETGGEFRTKLQIGISRVQAGEDPQTVARDIKANAGEYRQILEAAKPKAKSKAQSLTKDEKSALGRYQGGELDQGKFLALTHDDFVQMDEDLRSGKGVENLSPLAQDYVKNLESAIAKSVVKEPQTVYRGVILDQQARDGSTVGPGWKGIFGVSDPQELVGQEVSDGFFSSYSGSEDVAKAFADAAGPTDTNSVIFETHVKPGSQMVDLGKLSKGKSMGAQKEKVLQRGTRLRVVEVTHEQSWGGNVVRRYGQDVTLPEGVGNVWRIKTETV